jgi:hypothetical protein
MAQLKYWDGTSWANAIIGAQGPEGPAGAINSLSIGTVTNGLTAAATITGSAPSQILNLVLPLNPDAITNTNFASMTNKTLVSPAFTGIPIAPTATLGTSTTQVATTAFVQAALATVNLSTKQNVIPFQSSAPSSPTNGMYWVDSTLAAKPSLKVYSGGVWVAMTGGSASDDDQAVLGARIFA